MSKIPPKTRLRWAICSLLLFATVINYLDRVALGNLGPHLMERFHWSKQDFGWIILAFQVTYAVMNLPWGAIMDRIGVRRGFTIAVVWWSVAAMAHAFGTRLWHFMTLRALLGVGEAGNFPCGVKTIAEWLPQQERGTGAGLLNAGANIGTMIGGVTIAFLLLRFGWQGAFFFTGAAGLLFAIIWWTFYRTPAEHPALSDEERAWILQEGEHKDRITKVPWRQLIRERRVWAFILGKTFSDPCWGLFLFWLPTYLHDAYHLGPMETGYALSFLYLMADIGSIGGGWLGGHLISRGWSVNRARKTALAIAAFTIPIAGVSGYIHNLPITLALVSIALAGHQWWSSNLFTTTTDMFPSQAVGTVVGMGQVGGSTIGIFQQPLIGMWLDHFHSFQLLFVIATLGYPVAFCLFHLCAPKVDRAPLKCLDTTLA